MKRKRTPKHIQVTLRISQEQHDAWWRASVTEIRTLSDWMRVNLDAAARVGSDRKKAIGE